MTQRRLCPDLPRVLPSVRIRIIELGRAGYTAKHVGIAVNRPESTIYTIWRKAGITTYRKASAHVHIHAVENGRGNERAAD